MKECDRRGECELLSGMDMVILNWPLGHEESKREESGLMMNGIDQDPERDGDGYGYG